MLKLMGVSLLFFSAGALSKPDWEGLSSILDSQLSQLSTLYVDLCVGSQSKKACDQIVSSVNDMDALLRAETLPEVIEVKMNALKKLAEKAAEE